MTILFCFDSFSQNTRSTKGGLEHKNSSVYYFGTELSRVEDEDIRFLVAHELLHTFTPIRFKSDVLRDLLEFKSKKMSEHLWLYEGMTEYLAAKIVFRSSIFDTVDFLRNISDHYIASVSLDIPLNKLSQNIFDKQNVDKQNFYYTKGSILCFLLDLVINEKTNGSAGLYSIMNTIYKENSIFNEDSLFIMLSDKTNGATDSIIEKYLIQNIPIPTDFLSKLAYHYEVVDSQKSFFFIPMSIEKINEDSNTLLLYCPGCLEQIGTREVLISEINGEKATINSFYKHILNYSYPDSLVLKTKIGKKISLSPKKYHSAFRTVKIDKIEQSAREQDVLMNYILDKL